MKKLLGDRYKLGEMIGTGGMADVYIADDERLSRKVAVKVLRSDLARDPSFVARFRKEAFAAAGLNHPGIVAVYDSGEEPAPYIVMELVSGHTLRELIHNGEHLPIDRVLEIAEGILAALEYSHERGIVHRDIKPANVMITDQGVVKVMDFGIARIDSNSMTKTGIAMGTPNYISPEQLKGLPIDRRADLFSLGVVMYEMLLGKRPFKGENITSLIYAILHSEPEKPSSVNPQIPLLFDHIVNRALRKVPAERYQKATELMADLHDFVESFAKG